MKSLTPQEIEEIKTLQQEYDLLYYKIGRIEYQKQQLIESINKLYKQEEELSKRLIENYGKGNIDLESGIFTPVE